MTLLEQTAANLARRGFQTHICRDKAEAKRCALAIIGNSSVGIGGSQTVAALGLYEALLEQKNDVNWHWKTDAQDVLAARNRALAADCYVASANAVTADGRIVNIDGFGNRVAGTFYGPATVILLVGCNKLVQGTLDEAIDRAKRAACVPNARRLNIETPCTVTGQCEDCGSDQRICRVTVILDAPSSHTKAFHVLLVDEELGY